MTARLNRGELSAKGQPIPSTIRRDQGFNALALPDFHPDQLAYLERAFPVSVSPDHDLRRYDQMVGEQNVLAHIRELIRHSKG